MYGKAVGDLQKAFALETSLSGRNQIACELTKVTKWASGMDFSEHASEIPTVQARYVLLIILLHENSGMFFFAL